MDLDETLSHQFDLLKANAKIESLTNQLLEVSLSASNAYEAEKKKNEALKELLERCKTYIYNPFESDNQSDFYIELTHALKSLK